MEKKREKPEFDITDRGFNIKVWCLENDETHKGDALVEIRYQDELIREFIYPSYKIWNLAAHFKDIVDGEIDNDDRGYEIAGSTGLGGCILPKEVVRTHP